MEVTEKTIGQLGAVLAEDVDADIVARIAERLGISAGEAMGVYFSHPLAEKIESNEYGMQYLDPSYLADEILRQSPKS